MPYVYNFYSIGNRDKLDNILIPDQIFSIATPPSPWFEILAIGNRIVLFYLVQATGVDNFINKQARVNLSLFHSNDSSIATNAGFESDGILTGALTPAIYKVNNGTTNQTTKNIDCAFQLISTTVLLVRFDFYMTFDVGDFVTAGGSQNNEFRFLKSRIDSGSLGTAPILQNSGSSVYKGLDNFLIKTKVFDSSGLDAEVEQPLTGLEYVRVPVKARWYNADVDDNTFLRRYMREITVTSPTQLSLSFPSLTDATTNQAQGSGASVDANFNVQRNQLATGEDNTVNIILRGFVDGSVVNNPPTTAVRALLIRVDDIDNASDFITDLETAETLIPQGAAGSAQLDGAIYTPSDWLEDTPLTDDVNITFTLDGTKLVFGARYRIIINVYDGVNDWVTSHISPELVADFIVPVTPTIDGFIDTYNKRYSGNDLRIIAPHQRVKGRLEIDKASYTAALLGIGITGTFDGSLAFVSCTLPEIANVIDEKVEQYTASTLQAPASNATLSANMEIVQNDAVSLILEATFRIPEEYAGTPTRFRWVVAMNQPTQGNNFERVNIVFNQFLQIEQFENDKLSPNLLAIKYYDADLYPTTKAQILDICDKERFIVEVEKDPGFTGSINLIATIYESDSTGDTNVDIIQEQESWQPSIIRLPQLTAPALDQVDASWGGDDFASFLVLAQQLVLNQQYFITAIAQQQEPNYCPLPIGAPNANFIHFRDIPPTNWQGVCGFQPVISVITGLPSYAGSFVEVKHAITDNLGNVLTAPDVVQAYFGNTLFWRVDNPAITKIFWHYIADFQINGIGGQHTVRYEIFFEVDRPPAIPSGIIDLSSPTLYSCTDLG